jgi:glycosyltransferase involved in cell wall biosynthesis
MEYTNAEPKGTPLVSICLGTYNKQEMLNESLQSIKDMNRLCPFPYEVIVADDDPYGSSLEVCIRHGAYYIWNQNCGFSNPSIPRNCTLRLARGEYILQQSDDVIWQTEDSVEKFVELIDDTNVVFANVLNVDMKTKQVLETYTGPDRQKSYFFLGGLKRNNVVFNSEDYIFPAYDDDFVQDQMKKNGLSSIFTQEIVAHHLNHEKGLMSNGVDSSVWYYKNLKTLP